MAIHLHQSAFLNVAAMQFMKCWGDHTLRSSCLFSAYVHFFWISQKIIDLVTILHAYVNHPVTKQIYAGCPVFGKGRSSCHLHKHIVCICPGHCLLLLELCHFRICNSHSVNRHCTSFCICIHSCNCWLSGFSSRYQQCLCDFLLLYYTLTLTRHWPSKFWVRLLGQLGQPSKSLISLVHCAHHLQPLTCLSFFYLMPWRESLEWHWHPLMLFRVHKNGVVLLTRNSSSEGLQLMLIHASSQLLIVAGWRHSCCDCLLPGLRLCFSHRDCKSLP